MTKQERAAQLLSELKALAGTNQRALAIVAQEEHKYKEIIDVSPKISNPEDVCSNLYRVYPTVITTSHSRYNELYKQLQENIFLHSDGSKIWSMVNGKKVYFLEAISKEAFYNDHLGNLKPCRYNELKSYGFICLFGGTNFETMELYDIDGILVKKLVKTKQLFEERIDEDKEAKETVTIDFGELDFYVKSIRLKNDKGEVMDDYDYKDPVVKDGQYLDFYTQPFKRTLEDNRDGYTYKYRTNISTERVTTLEVIGSAGEKVTKQITLVGMQKQVAFLMQHKYSEEGLTISTNLVEYDKWFLDDVLQPTRANLKGELIIRAGLPSKKYQVQLADDENNRTKSYSVEKKSKNGVVIISVQLQGGSVGHWNLDDIRAQLERSELTVVNHLQTKILGKLSVVLEAMKTSNDNAYKEINRVATSMSDMSTLAKEIGDEIPFLGAICALIKIVSSYAGDIKAKADARTLSRQLNNMLKQLDIMVREVSEYQAAIENNDEIFGKVLSYYEAQTGGNVSTQVIINDIKKNYDQFL